jgi:hypothetical protein
VPWKAHYRLKFSRTCGLDFIRGTWVFMLALAFCVTEFAIDIKLFLPQLILMKFLKIWTGISMRVVVLVRSTLRLRRL